MKSKQHQVFAFSNVSTNELHRLRLPIRADEKKRGCKIFYGSITTQRASNKELPAAVIIWSRHNISFITDT